MSNKSTFFVGLGCQILDAQPDIMLESAIGLHVALLSFVLRVHSERLDYVDQVLVRFLDQFAMYWNCNIVILPYCLPTAIHKRLLT